MERKLSDQEVFRRKHLEKLIESNKNPYKIAKVNRTHNSLQFKNEFNNISKEDAIKNERIILLAGRVMAKRQTFVVIQDEFGKSQLYLDKTKFDETILVEWKEIDIGDLIAVEGKLMRTKTDELTLNVIKFSIISKSLRVLPEKWHGLVDEEARSRKRYVDLIMSPESLNTFKTRSLIISTLRDTLHKEGYIEVDTPVLQPILGGAAAKPFITKHNALDRNFYLRIAPELYLKRLIVGGFDKVFEIGRLFRNEGMDSTHNPEFTSMEAYSAYQDVNDMMNLAEKVISDIANRLNITSVNWNNYPISLKTPFRRISLVEAVKQKLGIDFDKINMLSQAIDLAKKHNVELKKHYNSVGHILTAFFEEFCEKDCIDPTFVCFHPVEVSPLAKRRQDDPRYTDRFELFIGGKEIMNSFSELNDPIDQKLRFEEQLKLKDLGDEEATEMDYDFVEALEYAMPPTAGIGIGIDRLTMLFTEKSSIRDVLLFPHMKEKNNDY